MIQLSSLAIQCPTCKCRHCLTLQNNHIYCKNDDCSFDVTFNCPICQGNIEKGTESSDITCSQCNKGLSLDKIAYIMENKLQVNYEERCSLCQTPTLHRPDINLVPRCLFYPDCSGQNDLFGEKKDPVVFLDFETSGLEIGKNSIIEIGALKVDELNVEHTFETFVSPIEPISPKIQSITGISNQMLEGAPTLKESMSSFSKFIEGCTVVAHNANFDLPWLITSLLRLEIDLPFNSIICTLEWARKNNETQCSLGKLSKKYNIMHNNAHRALADAVTTKELFMIYSESHSGTLVKKTPADYLPLCEQLIAKYADFVQA